MAKTTDKFERRADFLADKYGLSPQLTLIWVRDNPEKARRPMLPSAVRELVQWARLGCEVAS